MISRTARYNNREYSVGLVMYLVLSFAGVLMVLKTSELAIYSIGVLLIYTLSQKKIEYSYYMLMLLTALSVINSLIVHKDFNFYLVTRGSLFALAIMMTARAGFQKSAWFMSPFFWLFGYIFYMAGVSLQGWAPLISELKVVLFLVFMSALVQSVAAVYQSGVDIRKIRAGMVVVAIIYIFGSIAVIPFPQIGQSMINARLEMYGQLSQMPEISGLFNGMTWHSQTLGPLVAILNAFILSDYLCNFDRRNRIYQVLLASTPLLIYKTSSRTAFLAYLISLLMPIFFFMRERYATQAKKSRVLMGAFLMGLAVFLIFLVRPDASRQLEAFLRKASDADRMDSSVSLADDMTRTRMGLVEQGLANFRKSPLIGNGFQVSEEMQYMDKREAGIILSAPIEKGVLPVMVLEEGGLVGAFLFLCFIVAVYAKYLRLRFSCFLSTFTTFIALNSGEATFFSTSGSGGILWMICFSSLLMDVHRQRKILAEKQTQAMAIGRG